jgi:hypothetical protein
MLAQGCKLLVATVAFVVLSTGVASALQPIEPLGGQLRLTQQGADGDATIDVNDADVVYNSVRNQFLLVWEQTGGGETEIFGRILNGDGTPAAAAFRISRTPDPDLPNPPPDVAGLDSFDPAVAYDPERDRYGVVWSGEFSADGEQEIFLQVLSGAGALVDRETGAPTTTAAPAEKISSIGTSGTTTQDALT